MADGKLPFTVVSIMRNELDLLPRYFNSIEAAFGQVGVKLDVVIVDTGSTDGSVAYAQERGATVHEAGDRHAVYYKKHESKRVNSEIGDDVVHTGTRVFNFESSRNHVDGLATTVWCLSLDICDLVLYADPVKLCQVIEVANNINNQMLSEMKRLEPQIKAAVDTTERERLRKQIVDCNNRITWGYTYRLVYGPLEIDMPAEQSTSKLYNHTLEKAQWHCMVHEIFTAVGSSRMLPGEKTLAVRHAQRNGVVHSYLPGLAYAFLVKPPTDPMYFARMRYYFARELFYRGYYGNNTGSTGAKKYLAQVTDSPHNWVKERSASACHLAECYSQADTPDWLDKRRQCYVKALKLYPAWREPYIRLADIAYKQDDYAGCVAYARLALDVEKPTDVLFAENVINYGNEPYRLLYVGYTRLANQYVGARVDCRSVLQRALDIESQTGCNDDVHVYGWKLAYVNFRLHDKEKARRYFDKCHMYNTKDFAGDRHFFYS